MTDTEGTETAEAVAAETSEDAAPARRADSFVI